ncbi:MAG: PAS domain-containing protein [Phycisphaerae bacterium]|nr:PAS domain-containing protein [Phycisphaerae bacterium]
MNGILKEPIQRKVLFLAIVFVATFVVLLTSEGYMNRLSRDRDSAIHNQQARRAIGKVILRKLILIEFNLGRLATTNDRRDVDAFDKKISSSIGDIESALSVLRNGGDYEDVLPANFADVNEIREHMSFVVDKNSGYVIEVIELTPRILDIKQASADLLRAVNEKLIASNNSEKIASQKQIDLLQKQAHAFLLRSREFANRIFYDTNLKIQHLELEQAESIRHFALARYIIIAIFGLGMICICVLTIRQTGSIIEERQCAWEEVAMHRNHLTQLVEERTAELTRTNEELSAEIDERERMEEALRTERDKLLVLMAGLADMGIGIDIVGTDHKILFQNRTREERFGDLVGKACYEGYMGRDKPCDACPMLQAVTSGNTESTEVATPDGRQYEVVAAPLINAEGTIDSVVEVVSDITNRRRADEQLRFAKEASEKTGFELAQTNEQLERLFTAIPSILIGLSADHKVIRWNKEAEDIFQIPQNQAMGQQFGYCGGFRELEKINDGLSRCVENRQVVTLEEVRFQCSDGSEAFLGLTLNPFGADDDGDGDGGVLILGSDLTERRILQSQLTQAQKLESIGQLAAGIAHEINTPTQYVGDNTRFLQDSVTDVFDLLEQYDRLFLAAKEDSVNHEIITETEAVAQKADVEYLREEIPNAIRQSLEGLSRVSSIVAAMKNFSHIHGEEKTSVDLNQAIENTVTIARNEWKYVAEVNMNFAPDLPLVSCLQDELNQVFMNLIINAAHAIGDTTDEANGEKGTITIDTRYDDGWVEVRVSDTGSGIPEEIRNKIFDPFFTTKEVGKGTGQGLAISHSIVEKKHSGKISFETESGKGTTFIVRLPRHNESQENEPEPTKTEEMSVA